MKNTKTNQKEIDDDIDKKVAAEVQWNIYREQFEKDKMGKPKTLPREFDDDDEYVKEIIQQLKEYQKKLRQKDPGKNDKT